MVNSLKQKHLMIYWKKNINKYSKIKKKYLQLALIAVRISKWAENKEVFLNHYQYFNGEAKKL